MGLTRQAYGDTRMGPGTTSNWPLVGEPEEELGRLLRGCLLTLVATIALIVLVAIIPVLVPVAQAGWDAYQSIPGDPLSPERVQGAIEAMILELADILVPDTPAERDRLLGTVGVHILAFTFDAQVSGCLVTGAWPPDKDPIAARRAFLQAINEERARHGWEPVYLHPVYDAVAEVVLRVLYEILKLRWAAGEFAPANSVVGPPMSLV